MSHAAEQTHDNTANANGVGSGGLVRVLAEDGYHCSPDCPYLARWDHPFWHHTAWCWHNLKDLHWHDYWLADCTRANSSETMEKIRRAGRTKPPNGSHEPRGK